MKKLNALAICLLLSSVGLSQKEGTEKTYYPDGKTLRTEWEYTTANESTIQNITTRDSKTGQFTGYDKGGYSVGQKVPHGKWKEYYENGNLKAEYNYQLGFKEGEAKTYYPSGILMEKYSFHDNQIHGDLLEYYEDGQVFLTCHYNNGKREGEAKVYYSDGSIQYSIDYPITEKPGYETTVARGKAKLYSKDGILQGEGEVISVFEAATSYSTFYNGFLKDGVWKFYDESGKLFQSSTYSSNKYEGETIKYYPSGEVKEKINYTTIRVEGQEIAIIDGHYEIYFENGQLAKSGVMKTLVTKSKSDESKLEQQYYKVGDWKMYDKDGKLTEFVVFDEKNNVLVSMDADIISNQEEINSSLDFELLKSLLLDKHTKYKRFHFGEMLDKIIDYTNKEQGAYQEIWRETEKLLDGLIEKMNGCGDKNCLLTLDKKVESIYNQMIEFQSENVEILRKKLYSEGVESLFD